MFLDSCTKKRGPGRAWNLSLFSLSLGIRTEITGGRSPASFGRHRSEWPEVVFSMGKEVGGGSGGGSSTFAANL